MKCLQSLLVASLAASISACVTVDAPPKEIAAPAPVAQQVAAQQKVAEPEQKVIKRKVAIGRFTNETRYGKSFLRDGDQDPLGKQASDMLSTRLVNSGQFLVFERPDISKLEREQAISGAGKMVGVDALILGSITEFGRDTKGRAGFLSETKIQLAHAKVELRLVDPKTGYVFFSATGSGEASSETGNIAGFGNSANYDETLNDRAIGAAISDVQNALINKLNLRRWTTDILDIQGDKVFISGGQHQGLRVGDQLSVFRRGKTVTSAQSGFDISLPPAKIADIQVVSLFGDSEVNEGAITQLVSGNVGADHGDLFVSAKE